MFRFVLIWIVGCVGLGACDSKKTEAVTEEAVQKAATDIVENAREKAKKDLLASPGSFLDISDVKGFDKGIFNSYRQIVGMTILNRSTLPVQGIQGDVQWTNDKGERVASMPFKTKGSIPAGGTQTFSTASGTLENGTVETNANGYKLVISHVSIVE